MFHEDLGRHEGVSGIPQAFILFPFHSGKKKKPVLKALIKTPHFNAFENSRKLTCVARLLE